MLAIEPPEAQNETAPCSVPWGHREAGEGTSLLTTLGNLVVVCFAFLWEFLLFHLSGNQMEKKEQKKLGLGGVYSALKLTKISG